MLAGWLRACCGRLAGVLPETGPLPPSLAAGKVAPGVLAQCPQGEPESYRPLAAHWLPAPTAAAR